jgi:large subunit ribosomal protein L25
MAAIKELAAVTRSGTGKGAARSVRREARVPGVIYGGGEKPEPISVDFKDLNKHIYAGHFLTTIFELDLEGRKERVLPRDYQLDVVTDRPVHVDFLRLRPGSRIRTNVPVHVFNRDASPGVKKGGTVNLVRHTLELLAPAENIPEAIEIDLTGMEFHDAVHIADLKLPEGCRPTETKGNATVVTIVPPSVLPDEVSAETAAPATSGAPAAKAAAPAKAAAAAPAKGGAAPAKGGAAPAKAAPAKPAAKK